MSKDEGKKLQRRKSETNLTENTFFSSSKSKQQIIEYYQDEISDLIEQDLLDEIENSRLKCNELIESFNSDPKRLSFSTISKWFRVNFDKNFILKA